MAWKEYEAFKVAHKQGIPEDLCSFSYTTSSGPGGQNVNKVNTRAVLVLPLSRLSVPPYVMYNLQHTAHHISSPPPYGSLQISAQEHRTQPGNREEARKRLWRIMCEAWEGGLGGVTSEQKMERVRRMEGEWKRRKKAEKEFLKSKKADRRAY
ncbi:hypothetical protein BT69DRAFT_1275680 [Atractiella rhizophila]|nr:hypothetical protein BT69DRAFT_1275680 [Atractiella rhizophila]